MKWRNCNYEKKKRHPFGVVVISKHWKVNFIQTVFFFMIFFLILFWFFKKIINEKQTIDPQVEIKQCKTRIEWKHLQQDMFNKSKWIAFFFFLENHDSNYFGFNSNVSFSFDSYFDFKFKFTCISK